MGTAATDGIATNIVFAGLAEGDGKAGWEVQTGRVAVMRRIARLMGMEGAGTRPVSIPNSFARSAVHGVSRLTPTKAASCSILKVNLLTQQSPAVKA